MKFLLDQRKLRNAGFACMALLGGLVSQAHAQLSGSGQQLGAISQARGVPNPIAFANRSGALWTHHWSGSRWFWTNHGNPAPSDSVAFGIGTSGWRYEGANYTERWPFSWVVGANNVLYSRDYGFSTGAAWTWLNHGPVGSVIPVGATSGFYGSNSWIRPHAFFINSSGSLFSRDWTIPMCSIHLTKGGGPVTGWVSRAPTSGPLQTADRFLSPTWSANLPVSSRV